MRKTLKRMTAIMLSLLMLLTCIPNEAFADFYDENTFEFVSSTPLIEGMSPRFITFDDTDTTSYLYGRIHDIHWYEEVAENDFQLVTGKDALLKGNTKYRVTFEWKQGGEFIDEFHKISISTGSNPEKIELSYKHNKLEGQSGFTGFADDAFGWFEITIADEDNVTVVPANYALGSKVPGSTVSVKKNGTEIGQNAEMQFYYFESPQNTTQTITSTVNYYQSVIIPTADVGTFDKIIMNNSVVQANPSVAIKSPGYKDDGSNIFISSIPPITQSTHFDLNTDFYEGKSLSTVTDYDALNSILFDDTRITEVKCLDFLEEIPFTQNTLYGRSAKSSDDAKLGGTLKANKQYYLILDVKFDRPFDSTSNDKYFHINEDYDLTQYCCSTYHNNSNEYPTENNEIYLFYPILIIPDSTDVVIEPINDFEVGQSTNNSNYVYNDKEIVGRFYKNQDGSNGYAWQFEGVEYYAVVGLKLRNIPLSVTIDDVSLSLNKNLNTDFTGMNLEEGYAYTMFGPETPQTISVCYKMTPVYSGPKTEIKSVTLDKTGTFEVGKTLSNQTLKFTEPSGSNFTSKDVAGSGWYTDEDCETPATEATSFTKGTSYYKKVILKPNSTHEFKNTTTVSVPTGTVVSKKLVGKNLEVVIDLKPTGKVASINYTKPSNVTEYKTIDKVSVIADGMHDYAVEVGDSNHLKILTSDNSDNGFYLIKFTCDFDTKAICDTVDQILIKNVNAMTDENETNKTDYATFMKTHDYGWYVNPDDDSQIIVYQKLDFRKTATLTVATTPGTKVADVFSNVVPTTGSITKEVYEIVEGAKGDALDTETELETGKTYLAHIAIFEVDEGSTYVDVKVNGESMPANSCNGIENGYRTNDSGIIAQYKFECKQQSSGRKKKKVEEPKEDPKTPEEKLQEELLKDDVKKANSKEGEKINPTAKYINGYDDGTFKANNDVSNIELMSMVTELFDNVELKDKLDLNQGENYWGQEIIDKANALGLVPGNKDDKNYNLMGDVTRGDLAVVVYNLIKDYSNAPSISSRNNCHDAIGKNYEKEAAKLLELGIFKGYDDGMFHGDYTLTRAEAVVVINRALKSLGFEINMPKITLSFPDLTPDHWAYAEIMYAANK